MVQSAFLEQRRQFSPTGIGVVIAVHAGLIAAVALWKVEVIRSHAGPIVMHPIPAPTDPAPLPPPPRKEPRQPTRVTKTNPVATVPPVDAGPVLADPLPDPIPLSLPQPVDPPPPPPQPPKIEQSAHAKGDVRMLFGADDYPLAARERQEQGTVQAKLTVGADGRVAACTVLISSGSSALDSATCRVLKGRARFTPARDSNGAATGDVYVTPRITWRIDGEG